MPGNRPGKLPSSQAGKFMKQLKFVLYTQGQSNVAILESAVLNVCLRSFRIFFKTNEEELSAKI